MENWSCWHNFGQIYEYHGLVNNRFHSDRNTHLEWKGQNGPVLTDNGFFLRGKVYSSGSFKDYASKIPIDKEPCHLGVDTAGVYCLRICDVNQTSFNYIGISSVSIHERLLHHFIKIAGTTKYAGGRYKSDSKEFAKMREHFWRKSIDTSMPEFFKSVYLSFLTFKKSKKLEAKLLKIEGMGIQSFKNIHGVIPELNSRDETHGLEHFPIND